MTAPHNNIFILAPSPLLAEAAPPSHRWVVCSLLFLATTLSCLDRQIFALLKPMLDETMHWDNASFGLVNSAFQGAHAVGFLFFGWFVDRLGAKIGLMAAISWWSIAAAAHALVGNVGGFYCARVALGFGEGGNFPSAIKAVALWFPKNERALATALFNSGANVGATIAPAVVPFVALKFGWQAAFVLAGALGFLWLMAWLVFYEIPEKKRRLTYIRSDEADGVAPPKRAWLSFFSCRRTWAFLLAKFLTDPIWWFYLIWLPDFFRQTHGLDIQHSWPHLVGIYSAVSILSILASWMTGRLAIRGWSVTRARKSCMLLAALCAMPIAFVTKVDAINAVVLIALAASAHQAWSANLFTSVSDMFPQQSVASVIGIGGMAGALGGMIFPAITGLLLDAFKAKGHITAGYATLFWICACVYLLAFLVNHLLAPRFEQATATGVDFNNICNYSGGF